MPKIVILLIIAAVAAFFVFKQQGLLPQSKIYINQDTKVSGDYQIAKGKTATVKNGSKLTVEGKTIIEGKLDCDGGAINLEAKGDLVISGTLFCNRKEDQIKQESTDVGINLILGGNADFNEESIIATNSHLQIVESEDQLLKTQDDFRKAFNDVAKDTGEGIRIGPLFTTLAQQTLNDSNSVLGEATKSADVKKDEKKINLMGKIKVGVSVGHPDAPFPKGLDLEKVPKYLDYILVWFRLPNGQIQIEDAYMFTPDGHDGEDISKGCDINVFKAQDQDDRFKQNAMRMRMWAKTIKVNNFHLFLGDGGRGGNATTDKNCRPGKAIAGPGGNPANFKWTAQDNIEIIGGFYIYPGKGGEGGEAIAYGDKGDNKCDKNSGFDATAQGGLGAPNHRVLSVKGDVRGLQNIYIGDMIGGKGGDAQALAGDGGDAIECDCKGGKPGIGTAIAGKGGDVSLKYPQAVQRMADAKDKQGEDGNANTQNAKNGKDGPACTGDQGKKATPTVAPKEDKSAKSISGNLPGYFEFLDSKTYKPSQYVSGIEPHIIVATKGDPDARTFLPITLEIKAGGNSVWKAKIEGDAASLCRGSTGCSMNGPVIKDEWLETGKVEVFAYDKNGKLVAYFVEQ